MTTAASIVVVLEQILVVRMRIRDRAREANESDQVIDEAELDVLAARLAILREQTNRGH